MIYIKGSGVARNNSNKVQYPSSDDFIAAIREAERIAGKKLPIVGGSVFDDTAVTRITILNTEGCDWEHYKGTLHGIFLG